MGIGVFCPKAGFSWKGLPWCGGSVGQYWGGFLLPSSGSCLRGGRSKRVSHSFTLNPSRIQLLLLRKARWIFNNRGVILTLTIHWLGPQLFLPWYSKATLAIWSEGLAKGPYQKHTSLAVRFERSRDCKSGFVSIDLSWPFNTNHGLNPGHNEQVPTASMRFSQFP